MGVDKGGLNYKIQIEEAFAGGLANFRSGIAASRAEMARFRSDLAATKQDAAAATRSLNEVAAATARGFAQAQRTTATASAQAIRARQEELKAIQALAQAQRSQPPLNNTQTVRNIAVEGLAVRSLALAYRQLATAKAAAGRAGGRAAQSPPQPPLPPRTPRIGGAAAGGGGGGGGGPNNFPGVGQINSFNNSLNNTNTIGSRVLATFQRILGAVLALTAIRSAINGFISLVKESVNFNAELEQSTLGIATLLTAVGEVRDQTGGVVTNATALSVAITESRRQIQLLRRDSSVTAATLNQVVEAFQNAVAPGIEAGLKLDQIRQFAVQISQAAAAIDLPQQQLAEEIRSLLAGTISVRNTRIATALGITNEDIRNAKQLGVLAQFLTAKFEAFTVANKEATQTFNVLQAQAKATLLQLLQEGNQDFFKALKDGLRDVIDIIRTVDPITGVLGIRPEAVVVVKALNAGLVAAVEQARALAADLNFGDSLSTAQTVAEVISATAQVLRGVIAGFVKGIEFVRNGIQPLLDIIKALTGISLFDNDNLSTTVQALTKIVTIYLAISLTANILLGTVLRWGRALLPILQALKLVSAFQAVITFLTTLTTGQWIILLGVIAAAVIAVASFTDVFDHPALALERIVDKTTDWVSKLLGLPAIINKVNDPLAKSSEIVKEFRDATIKAKDELILVAKTLGLEGATLEEQRLALEGQADLREKSRKIIEETDSLQRELLVNSKNRLTVEERIDNLQGRLPLLLRNALPQVESLVGLFTEQHDLQNKILIAEKAIDSARKNSTESAVQDQQRQLVSLRKQLDQTNTAIEETTNTISRFFHTNNAEQSQQLFAIVNDRVGIDANERSLLERINQLQQDRQHIEEQVNRIVALRIQKSAEEANFTLRRENELAITELGNAIKIRDARLKTRPERNLVAARAERDLLLEQQALANANRIREEEALLRQRNNLLAQADLEFVGQISNDSERRLRIEQEITDTLAARKKFEEQKKNETDPAALDALNKSIAQSDIHLDQLRAAREIEDQITEQLRQHNFQRDQENLKIDDAILKVRKAREIVERPVASGFLDGLQAAAEELPTLYEGVFNTVKGTITGFADFASNAIVDAFDPTKKVDLRERFAIFLRGIALQIISLLVSLAITTALLDTIPGFAAVLNLTNLAAGGGAFSGGAVAGFHRGGRAGRRGRGMVDGGGVVPNRPTPRHMRPAGLHPADTVPIWADPSEWVIRGSSSMMYGAKVMGAINEGLLDPFTLKAMAGAERAASPANTHRANKGFALGGSVRAAAATAISQSPIRGSSGRLVRAIMAPSQDQMDRWLRGGGNGLIRFLENSGFQRGAA